MRPWMLIVVALFSFAQQPAKPPESKGSTESKSTQVGKQPDAGQGNGQIAKPAPAPPTDSQHPSAVLNAATNKPDDDAQIQGKLVTFTGLLVVVGFLQFGALVGQVVIYCRQAKIMARQRNEMVRQRVTMRRQLETMQGQLAQMESAGIQTNQLVEQATIQANHTATAANAAKQGAESATRNTQAFINKERPLLIIEGAI